MRISGRNIARNGQQAACRDTLGRAEFRGLFTSYPEHGTLLTQQGQQLPQHLRALLPPPPVAANSGQLILAVKLLCTGTALLPGPSLTLSQLQGTGLAIFGMETHCRLTHEFLAPQLSRGMAQHGTS